MRPSLSIMHIGSGRTSMAFCEVRYSESAYTLELLRDSSRDKTNFQPSLFRMTFRIPSNPYEPSQLRWHLVSVNQTFSRRRALSWLLRSWGAGRVEKSRGEKAKVSQVVVDPEGSSLRRPFNAFSAAAPAATVQAAFCLLRYCLPAAPPSSQSRAAAAQCCSVLIL